MNSDVQFLNNVWRWLSGGMEPLGYRPGMTLSQVEQNLQPYECERLSDRLLHVHCPHGLTIEVQERVNRQFRSFSVNCHFRLRGYTSLRQPVSLRFKNGDLLGRQETRCRAKIDNDATRHVQAVLCSDAQLMALLARLQFRALTVKADRGEWVLDIEHFAASELVSGIPIGNSYQRLSYDQRVLMIDVMRRAGQLMEDVSSLSMAA